MSGTVLVDFDALKKFREYQTEGLYLYRMLIKPVKPFLISDKIFVKLSFIIKIENMCGRCKFCL